ncbi:hypothetical protein GCM10027034_46080 [Ramlibacter solisilvae]|uniref:hypothetical protein n=1 Tax=Ramlibacter tataouinensis TaxID=94132 RepID=UPI00077730BC|nr:hypothetical protein [Ramlibacter tataouinensis]
MHYRMTSRRRKPRGSTASQQGEAPARAPRTPHERDESADSQQPGEASQGRMATAAREDVERGLVDTDKGPVLDETYERVRSNDTEKKFSP